MTYYIASDRRKIIKSLALSPLVLSAKLSFGNTISTTEGEENDAPFLFTFCANGGASIIDSFLPVIKNQANNVMNAYPEDLVYSHPQSPLRCVKNIPYALGLPVGPQNFSMPNFLQRHYRDMLVLSQEVTSVNHLIAAKRSLTGNGINKGRTLGEAYGAQYGNDFILPFINMGIGGYAEPGDDDTLAVNARQEIVADANLFALSTHGYKNLANQPQKDLMDVARNARTRLDDIWQRESHLAASDQVQNFLKARTVITKLEDRQLFEALNLIQQARTGGGNSQKNSKSIEKLASNPEIAKILQVLPDVFDNPFSAKVALAYLLARHRVSGSINLSMSDNILFDGGDPPSTVLNLPLGFDWSHNNHQGTQNSMWRSLLQGVDALITLLKATPLSRNSSQSLWDRSLVYVATEFGRSKELQTGSGHHVNNGTFIVSPLVKGNQFLGSIDSSSLLTKGFDYQTGKPEDRRPPREGEIYSLICEAMGIDFKGRTSISAALKA